MRDKHLSLTHSVFLLTKCQLILIFSPLAKTAEGLCTLLSPSVVQWEAMTVFLESVVSQIFKSLEEQVTESIFRTNIVVKQ